MGKSKKTKVVKQSFKKELKKQIAFQLTNSLGELKTLLGDKKFSSRIRKASKLLSSGVKVKSTASANGDKQVELSNEKNVAETNG